MLFLSSDRFNKKTRNILDCNHSIVTPRALYSPIFLQNCYQFHESGSHDPCGDIQPIANFSLRMRISAIFLLPAEVLLTDSELHTPISYSASIVNVALSGLVFEIWAWDRQTTDKRPHCMLKVSNLLLQAGHQIIPHVQITMCSQAFPVAAVWGGQRPHVYFFFGGGRIQDDTNLIYD